MTIRPWRPATLPAVLLVALLLAATGCGSGPDPVAAPPTGPPPSVEPLTEALPAPTLRWSPCPAVPDAAIRPDTPGLNCAAVPVPLDYSRPGDRTITVTISRLSTGPDRPAVLSNPGGPGAPGLFNPSMWDAPTGGRLAQHYDLIGFDPRGVGRSTPLDCRVDPVTAGAVTGGAARTTIEQDAAASRRFAQACAAATADLAPYMTTLNTARDLEMVRRALEQPRLSFLGMSYGTELATTFASLFPGSTDRVLLDSAQDVTRPNREATTAVAPAVQARFDEIAEVLARQDGRYHLGTTPEMVQASYLRATQVLEKGPARLGDDVITQGSLNSSGLVPALSDDADIELLGLVVGFVARVPGGPTEQQVLDYLGPPESGGAGASGLLDGQSVSENVSIYWSVRCGDDAWSRDVESYRRAIAEESARTPATRGRWSNITPCAFWGSEPREPRLAVTDQGWQGAPNILILHNAGDYRAPEEGIENLARGLGTRAVTLTAPGREHGVFWSDECARDRALDWMIDGEMPSADETRC